MAVSPEFRRQLAFGQLGESRIARWLRAKGYTVLPVYETEIGSGKGPRLFLPENELIAPDMLCFAVDMRLGTRAYWIEAKHKTAFSWYRMGQRWVTGIDLRHYQDYVQFQLSSPWPLYLMFWHEGGQAKDSPPSPRGLYGNSLKYLIEHESHRSDRHGTSGMVYWSIGELTLFDSLQE